MDDLLLPCTGELMRERRLRRLDLYRTCKQHMAAGGAAYLLYQQIADACRLLDEEDSVVVKALWEAQRRALEQQRALTYEMIAKLKKKQPIDKACNQHLEHYFALGELCHEWIHIFYKLATCTNNTI